MVLPGLLQWWGGEFGDFTLGSLELQAFFTIAGLWLHWLLTRRHLPEGLRRLLDSAKSRNTTSAAERDAKARVEQELAEMMVGSWKYACRYFVQIHVLPVCVSAYELQQGGGLPGLGFLFFVLVAYVVFLLVATGSVEVTPQGSRSMCGIIHACVLGCVLCSTFEDEYNYKVRKDFLFMPQLLLAIIFPDPGLVFGFALGFAGAHVWGRYNVYGVEALDNWFAIQQAFQLFLFAVLPVINQSMHRERIEASLQSADADTLVSAFRQMLRGVCDGDVLLDSSLRICGDATCLQRLLGTQDNLTGRSFQDLVIEQRHAVKTFEKFLAGSSSRSSGEYTSAPERFRVCLRGAGRTVAMDTCHVSLPKQFGAPYHLLSMTEDADARIRVDAAPDAIPSSLLSSSTATTSRGASSEKSFTTNTTSRSESVEVFEELSQLTLMINASTELLDIREALVRFTRRSEDEAMRLGMPSLKRFVRPLDWHGVETELRNYGRSAGKRRSPKSKQLPPLKIRVPGESSAYLLARQVEVTSVYQGLRPEGQPAYLHLQLSKFAPESQKRRVDQPEPVQEANEEEEEEWPNTPDEESDH